jgi:hypothetical protein
MQRGKNIQRRGKVGRRDQAPRPAPLFEETGTRRRAHRAGVTAPQRRGVKFGRRVKLTPEQIEHAQKLIDKGKPRQYDGSH